MRRDPYRDQAEKSRQEIKSKSNGEKIDETKDSKPSRAALHGKKRNEKAVQKKSFPLIRVLLALFVLLPLTVAALSLTIFNDDDSLASGNKDQPFQFQKNELTNSTESKEDSVDTVELPEESIPVYSETEDNLENQETTDEEPEQETNEELGQETSGETVEETVEETPTEEVTVEQPQSTTTTYTVQAGETLYRIAINQVGSADGVEQIKQLNGLNNNEIYPGQVLEIPAQ